MNDRNIQVSPATVPSSNRAWCPLVLPFDFAHAVFVPLSTFFSRFPRVENFLVRLGGFSVKVSVAIRGSDALMAGKYLRHFQITFCLVGHGDKIVTEIMEANKASIYASLLDSAVNTLLWIALDRFPHPTSRNGSYFFSCADVVASKQGL